MLSRRELLLTPVAFAALGSLASRAHAAGRMSLALHQATSSRAGFRPALEGWAKAGITQVEIVGNVLDAFLKTEPLSAAKRLLSDLGLKPVSGAGGSIGLLESLPDRAATLDAFRKRCEQWAELGIPIIYSTTGSSTKPTPDLYKVAADNAREVAGIARQFSLTTAFEFQRTSTLVSTLPTMLSITRAAAAPNLGVLFDCYHFWSGLNRLEDLDAVKPGEVKHVHFQDTPDMTREMLDLATRVPPGDGIAPLVVIAQKLAATGYAGPLSVELPMPKYSAGDPLAVATEIKTKAEAVMRKAGVL